MGGIIKSQNDNQVLSIYLNLLLILFVHKYSQNKQIILYLSYDGMTDNLGQSQVMPYLIGLAKKNIHFNIISFEKKENYLLKKESIKKKLNEASITWTPKLYTKKPPVISTLFDIAVLFFTVKKQIKNNNIAAIHCRSYIAALIGLYFKKKNNIPFVFDMRGFWADERVEGGVWNTNKYIYNKIYTFFKTKEKQFFSLSDKIISLTNNAKHEIVSWKLENIDSEKISVIPCCADLDFFSQNNYDEKSIAALKSKLSISETDFVISYLGSVGTWYMLNEMFAFFNTLKKHKPSSKFLFVTADNPDIIYNTAKKYNINANELIIKKADRNEVPLYILASQLSIFFIKPSYSKKASSPTKMGEILGLGVPIICNAGVGDVGEIMTPFSEAVINKFNNEEYEKICANLEQILATNKTKLINLAHQYYNLDKGIDTYYSIYKELNIAK